MEARHGCRAHVKLKPTKPQWEQGCERKDARQAIAAPGRIADSSGCNIRERVVTIGIAAPVRDTDIHYITCTAVTAYDIRTRRTTAGAPTAVKELQ